MARVASMGRAINNITREPPTAAKRATPIVRKWINGRHDDTHRRRRRVRRSCTRPNGRRVCRVSEATCARR